MRVIKQMKCSLAIIAILSLVLSIHSIADDLAHEFQENLTQAKRGNAAAQVQVGMAYESGRGVEKDLGEALAWYRKAATQGSGAGMLQVGYQYEAGGAVEKDAEIAAEWFKKALGTDVSSMAGHNLVRLSRTGLIEDTYVGIPVEGGSLTTRVDLAVSIEKALADLAANPRLVETGKAYWIGYNPEMLCVGARGENALPALVGFVKNATDPEVRNAGLLAIHLVGIECRVTGRFGEDFRNRKAREALWELMKVDGLTDQVSQLLKRDPWPADVPPIMDALRTVEGDCPATLNALLRYSLGKRTVDPEAFHDGGRGVRFTKPKSYSERDYVMLAIGGITESWGKDKVTVEDGLLEGIAANSRFGNSEAKVWQGTVSELLLEVKDFEPGSPSSYVLPGRNLFYYVVSEGENERTQLYFCGAATAEKRWLDWWDKFGKDWFCADQR